MHRTPPPRAPLVALLVAALACSAATAATATAEAPGPAAVRVFAAASLTEVVEALAASFAAGRVVPSFGSSSELARQIRDGAPADVFLSASPDWIDYLRDAGALAGDPIVLARNQLVCIAPRGSPLAAGGVTDVRELLARLGAEDRIAIADEGVPAGDYARKAALALGVGPEMRSRWVGQKDVRAVLHAVEQGELQAGFVYATDAKVADVAQLFALPAASHPPIEYQAAVLRGAASPAAAQRFLAYLQSEPARAALTQAGFALP